MGQHEIQVFSVQKNIVIKCGDTEIFIGNLLVRMVEKGINDFYS
jgi:hypothetical protein